MRKPELAKRLARRSALSEAEAADRLDRVVYEILENSAWASSKSAGLAKSDLSGRTPRS